MCTLNNSERLAPGVHRVQQLAEGHPVPALLHLVTICGLSIVRFVVFILYDCVICSLSIVRFVFFLSYDRAICSLSIVRCVVFESYGV